jgi:regulator of protease activity HflC (stomatin/prohibitin superfamily)
LGVQIIAVNLLDAHPPVEKVAPAFQNVIGSMEEKESMILKAQAYREKVLPQIEAKKMRLIEEANAYSYKVTKVSKAESERFNKQLQAYAVMPFIYKLRTYLSLLENDAKDIRKFIVSSTLPYEVYELNFEQKQRLDLIDADLDTITQK